jgi:hypothetical protein
VSLPESSDEREMKRESILTTALHHITAKTVIQHKPLFCGGMSFLRLLSRSAASISSVSEFSFQIAFRTLEPTFRMRDKEKHHFLLLLLHPLFSILDFCFLFGGVIVLGDLVGVFCVNTVFGFGLASFEFGGEVAEEEPLFDLLVGVVVVVVVVIVVVVVCFDFTFSSSSSSSSNARSALGFCMQRNTLH